MATHLDLQEQEQVDALKAFWKQYGNLITWALVAALLVYAGITGWQWWQREQAAQGRRDVRRVRARAAGRRSRQDARACSPT